MSKKKRRPAKPARQESANRYKTPKYVEYIFSAEIGILSADAVLPEITDGEVVAALRELVGQVTRSKGLPRYREQPQDTAGLIGWLIVQNWDEILSKRRKLSPKEIVGCLEVVIESVETRMRKPNQRKYLNYLKKFMKRAGVSIEARSISELEEEDDEMFYDLDGMSLAEVGQLWLQKPDIWGIEDAFENKAHAQIVGGQAEQVITLCAELLEQAGEPYTRAILLTVQGKAYRHLGQTEKAMDILSMARSLDEGFFGSRHAMAEIYYEQGQYEQAIEVWRECLGGDRYDAYIYEQIARSYRQMGDLAGEETAWRGMLKVKERPGCIGLLARLFRGHQSVSTLMHLADCLQRQGKMDDVQAINDRLKRARPHPRDPFEDWVYWVRFRLEHQYKIEKMLSLLHGTRQYSGHLIWSELLLACVYDWLDQPRQSAPLWKSARQKLLNAPHGLVLSDTRDILGDLLPASSRLFTLTTEIEKE